MKTKVSSWALILLSSMLITLVAIFSCIAIANASPSSKINTKAVSELPAGIQIWTGTGAVAQEGQDYSLVTDPGGTQPSQIKLISDNLTVEGGGWSTPVDIGLIADATTTCKNLTIKNLYLNYKGNHSAIRVDLQKPTQAANDEVTDVFTLNVEGECYIYQLGNITENNRAICFEDGIDLDNVNINGIGNGDTKAKLECYTNVTDTIFSDMASITFDGQLQALAYVTEDAIIQGDVIDWSEEAEHADNNNLTIKGEVELDVGNASTKNETCIYAGTLSVLEKASLYAINNCTTTNLPVVKAQDNIVINTEGEVFIDAYNEKSWQAIECNNLTINKCDQWFTAIAQDYTAIECRGDFTIGEDAIEKVYISGSFVPNSPTDNRAHRAAFTVKHPRNLIVPDGYLMFGNENMYAPVENINQRAVATFSSGLDASYSNTPEYDIYTPVLANLTGELPTYANSVIFKTAKEVVFVPGKNATYSTSGYRDCFKYKDEDVYFEDYDLQIPIENYNQWKSESGNGYVYPIAQEFDSYRQTIINDCGSMIERGSIPGLEQLIANAQNKVANYVYDNKESLSINKANLDKILVQLDADIDAVPLPIPSANSTPGGNTPNPANSGVASQTADNLTILIVALLALVAIASLIVILKKKNAFNDVVNSKTGEAHKISIAKLMLLISPVIVLVLIFSGFMIANASNVKGGFLNMNNSSAIDGSARFAEFQNYPGITITKNGQPAIEGTDYDSNAGQLTIDIKSDDLVVSGGTEDSPIDVSIYVVPGVTRLTIQNLSIISHKHHDNKYGNTLTIDLNTSEEETLTSPSNEGPWNAPDEDFTLTVLGNCYISQTQNSQGGSAIYVNEGGTHGVNITGPEGSYLETYTDYFESIFLHKVPLMFSGDLEATILSDSDRCINWRDQHGTDMLFVADNAILNCGALNAHNYQAIVCGSIFVVNNASLNAISNNGKTAQRPTVDVRHFFGISTTGEVIIGNVNAASWQAITCERLLIVNCSNFIAFSSDYTAIQVSEALSIQTPNVIICGEYNREETTNKARMGAFTIDNINNLYISPDLMALASDQAYDEPYTATSTMMVQTRGEDISNMYTPVVCDGNFATIAKTVTFTKAAHNLELVPALAPTFSSPGHKEYYQCRDCGVYYEEPQHETRIPSLEFWLGPRGNGYIAPLTEDFQPFKANMVNACANMLAAADSPEIRALIEAAQAQINAYAYNDAISLAANKLELNKIYYQLYNAVDNIIKSSADYINATANTYDNLPFVIVVACLFVALIASIVYFRKDIISWALVRLRKTI